MIFALLFGCSADENDSTDNPDLQAASGTSATNGNSEQDLSQFHHIDFVKAFEAYPPDTVMLTVGKVSVTWEQFFMTLYSSVMSILYSVDGVPDWDEVSPDGITYKQMALESALERKMYFIATYHGADNLGLALSRDDLADLQHEFDSYAEENGGEDAFMHILWQIEGIRSREMFDYMFGANILMIKIFNATFGENAELLSNEAVAAYTEEDRYLMAKHILIGKEEGASGDMQRDLIEGLLEVLRAYEGNDFELFFTQLMHEYSEDPELELFPDGYLFKYDEFNQGFASVTADLVPGEISGILETDYSYHIILRLPVDFDAIPIQYIDSGEYYSLRYATAVALFDELFEEWIASLTPVFTAEYHSLDFSILFTP